LNNLKMAKAYLREAIRRIKTAEHALEEGGYAYCIRQSQEAVELALKGSLRLVGIEPPKWHDVGPILLRERDRFPEWFKQKLEEMASISRWLRREREPSMYGDEETGLPPNELYTRNYAEKALKESKWVVKLVSRLIEEAIGSTT